MFQTKYEVSLRPNTYCFKSSPRSPAPQLFAQIFNCPACSAVHWCNGHNLEWQGPFCGWGTLAGPCGCRSWVRTCSELCSSGSRGLWLPGPLVLSTSMPTVHESMNLVRCTGGQPADRGHSFGCQQDEPSASLVTNSRDPAARKYWWLVYQMVTLSYQLYCLKNMRIPKQHAVREILCSRIKLPTSRFFNGTNSDPQPASQPAPGPFG